MGGERASKVRQREAGQICCKCSVLLGPPPPGHKPGYRTGERFCLRCEPRSFRITCNVFQRGWCVHFVENNVGLGPWLLFDSEAEVKDKVFAWGHAELGDYEQQMDTYGRAAVTLCLTRTERAALIRRARGWPWTGYELLQMRAAGRYPPQRLTPAQERHYWQTHKR